PDSGVPSKLLQERGPLDLGVEALDPRVEVVAIPRFEGGSHDLHVLLRNTPSPAPQDGYFIPSRVTTPSSWSLLRHRLLREAHAWERLACFLDCAPRDDPELQSLMDADRISEPQ